METPSGRKGHHQRGLPKREGQGQKRSALAVWIQKPLVHYLLLISLGLIIYSNTFHVPFQWDEDKFIARNPFVQNLRSFFDGSGPKGHGLYWAFRNRYVGFLSFAANYRLHGVGVVGYHIVNVAIHLINAVLVYLLVQLMFRTPLLRRSQFATRGNLIALFSGLLFVSHPVQTEAVTYIFQRLASLVSLFYLLSIVLYLQSRISEKAGPKYVCYGLSLVSCLIAMKTKENAFTLPFTIALLEILFCQGPLKKRLLFLIPFLLTSLIIPLTIIGIGKPLNEMITRMNPSVFGYRKIEKWEYLYTQFRVVVTYLRLLVFPVAQNFSYDYPVYQTFLRPEVIASFIFLSLLFLLAIYLIYRSRRGEPIFRLIGFGILWFFMTLSIESGIIPIAMVINEYRLYLPSVGFFIAVVSGASLFVRRLDSKQAESVFRWFALLVIFIFSLATYSRNTLWGDGVRLWEDTVSKSPRKCQPLINLGWAYEQKGQIEETIRTYEAALRLCPGRSELYTSLGSLYARQNQFEEAISSLERAVRLNPDFGLTYIILGTVYGKMEKLDEAISAFQKALRLQFDTAETHHKLGLIYEKQKRPDEAIQSFREAIALAPADPEPHYHLGLGYMRKGRYEEAVRAFQDAIRRRPNFVDAHNDLGVVFAIQGKLEAAMDQFRLVLRIQPQNSMARANFARAQNEMRRRTEESSRK